jgi:2-hydroxychromene-2-carboxylate isomerase
MQKTIEFFFDLGSPTAFLAHTQLKKIAKKYGAKLIYEPILLGAVHKATNNIAPGMVPTKGRYMLMQDLPRFVKRYDIEFKMNPYFPINTLTLMRGCYAAKEMGCFEQYVNIIFDAMWVRGLNLGNETVLMSVLDEAGINSKKLMDFISKDSIKEQLKGNTSKSISKGAFGAPTIYVGDQMFFGQDRLDFIEEELAK